MIRRVELSGANTPDGSVTGIELEVRDSGTSEGARPPVVLCHGFPELSYSWRHQIAALENKGFRVLAPDQRGYGNSSAPETIDQYGVGQLCGDLADLLDAEGIDRAVFVGHDWGGLVAWAMPVLFPDRCAGVVGVCTPYIPFATTDAFRKVFGDDPNNFYMLWFQEPGVAEAEMDQNVRPIFEKLMRGGIDPAEAGTRSLGSGNAAAGFNPFKYINELGIHGDPVFTPEDLEVYVSTFERTGFRGGINWYRNFDVNAAGYPQVGTVKLDLPSLMICAEWDPALPPAMASHMPDMCSDLEMTTINGAGHWVQQERPDEVNAILLDWLDRRFPID